MSPGGPTGLCCSELEKMEKGREGLIVVGKLFQAQLHHGVTLGTSLYLSEPVSLHEGGALREFSGITENTSVYFLKKGMSKRVGAGVLCSHFTLGKLRHEK